ncbi:hypothetical protein GFC29_1445 [Anoxybacillus sp. B7M1]|jgi:uncharacterized protein YpmB|uniref:cell wall elongation regulator TseB-like domain-containing protein n=1 Tax=unclassified Anoxybacillus TaxID=2639704 RepID=UPI0005CCF09B|nr:MULTISPECIES: DUF5590 domain-containing protein [unclassified Anoxybacillus]ANB57041.1 hypothetical protein GFC28_180 [Anoxybacillus sp. B2M1]ANB64802.1 hypothetical protein GFC29_1445 [Anoxybacillus sp. B7M1]
MKKWGILCFVVLCIFFWQAASVYHTAIGQKQSLMETARKRAIERVAFARIDQVYTYYGEKTYIVFMGDDRKGARKIVWVPEKSGSIVVKDAKSGITQEEAIKKLTAERNPKKIVSAKLGMEKGVPLWELTYIDQNNRYSFYYLSFKDGTFLKRYSFQQS